MLVGYWFPFEREPSTPREICLPTEVPMLRATLLPNASPTDWRRLEVDLEVEAEAERPAAFAPIKATINGTMARPSAEAMERRKLVPKAAPADCRVLARFVGVFSAFCCSSTLALAASSPRFFRIS